MQCARAAAPRASMRVSTAAAAAKMRARLCTLRWPYAPHATKARRVVLGVRCRSIKVRGSCLLLREWSRVARLKGLV